MKPFLSQLGIPPAKQSLSPTPSDFPPAFNTNNRLIWAEAVRSTQMSDDAGLDWGTVIKAYVKLCVAKGTFPFSNTKQSTNDLIYQKLMTARKSVVKFMNLSKIMEHVVFRKTRREIVMTQVGFVVRVYGDAVVQDPTFGEWLLKMPYPGFNIKSDGKWIKDLGRDTRFVVYNDYASGTQRWHVGYEITCSLFPEIPGHHLASKGELETFLLEVIWLPILKSHRPYRYHRRLI